MDTAHKQNAVLSLVWGFLHPANTKALTEYSTCMGWVKSKDSERSCARSIGKSRRKHALEKYNFLSSIKSMPLDGEGLASVESFLKSRHCHDHVGEVIARFMTWKTDHHSAIGRGNIDCESQPSSLEQKRSSVDGELDSPSSGTYQQASPSTSPTGVVYSIEDDTISDVFSELTMSPGQESSISFSDTSFASTAFTTPDATPMSSEEFPLPIEPASRPETPCPIPESLPNDSITEQDLEHNSDVQELLAQEDGKGPGMRDGLIRRMKTQKRGKLPLLIAIEHDWTKQDHEKGVVYIFKHKKEPALIKIGWTRADSQARHGQRGNCYAIDTTPHWESEQAFVGAYRVEQLVQKQLIEHNLLNHEYKCPHCEGRHQEWFRCDPEDAKALIKLWTEFVCGNFYDTGFDIKGNRYGRLSQKGRDFMDSICNVTPDDLQRRIRAKATGVSRLVGEEVEGVVNKPLSLQNGLEFDSTTISATVTGNSPEEDDEVREDHFQQEALAEEKRGKKYHFKQFGKITLDEIKYATESLREKLNSAWLRSCVVIEELRQGQYPNMDETVQKFYGVFYANELNKIDEESVARAQGPRVKTWNFQRWRKSL
ncbi:hypothetical protein BKA67DRAFT_644115 [Truncatella angustata]|uniref:Bacteriophage T5 Orf172 DNA-binding domain-containing protein n=1 Tax=Truncatella angustata TaxID=152316 RepID=A0A9P8USI1_9PEZI|nr:uncharacterized protein BKA67DRAFT_644115 [Truncatella angustata]KAH6658255.1 hypothetical protein BKA67DRAFT_644115 [Truncatella angustata]